MSDTERINIELPVHQAAQVRRIVDAGGAPDISTYVSEAIQTRLDRDEALSELRHLFDRKGQKPSAEHLAWARDVLGVNEELGGPKE
ncbi:hypothetical protein FB566_0408 [Stackebrandtia endophytica]|uniref:Arc/MetJ-type ribon-helix-helix transcriptional regulator n=1 Tax=Stackebrandtia endophytica TaxID=1496996 RepID=A0A543AQQ7_9ACTN|nr:hypothetical protein [Stackebrandtia endophytica]TQL74918.1 hypothetical protein FB566_0408 [Stackebrandtia endophytica]